MCGIAGILGVAGDSVAEEDLKRLTGELAHRGPDDNGWVIRGPVGLAATRLAIVDLTDAGHQPMADERCALAYNGEIYNHGALRADLEREGVRFRGHSDTEVLFELLHHRGVEATLPALRGMFAFSWWDGEHLYLARDRFGIKPLVWSRHREGIAWASESRALRAVLPLRPDRLQTVFAFLSLGDRSGERTMFAGVEQVPPGHYLRVDRDGHVDRRRWHTLAAEVDEAYFTELEALPFADLVTRFDGLLRDAVDETLMADTPMGVFVSGGVDSALLAHHAVADGGDHLLMAADVTRPRSEAGAARLVAQALGRPLELTRFEPPDLLEQWAPATLAYEVPLVTHMNSLPFGALARAARARGVKPVLTGEGADELFFGYTETVFRPFRSVLRAPIVAIDRLYASVPGLAKRVLPELRNARERQLAAISEGYEQARLSEEALDAFAFLGPRRAARHAAVLDLVGGHLLSLLHRNDRMGMAASIESRFPYLGEDLVRFALNLPISAKLRWRGRVHNRKHPFLWDKAVLRSAAARHLPTSIADRPKDGFPTVGHPHLMVTPAYFEGGWVSEELRLTQSRIERICTMEPSLVAPRLASIDVFGRLFGHEESVAAVTERIQRHVSVRA
jgi:asparagine synthase (glutamine-hydrolysing)